MQAPITPKISLKKVSGTFNYKIVIPQDVEQKIRYLLEKIHNIEWSGKLFYDYKGSFENNDLEIICRDIFLMDIGNSTYTEFEDESTDFGNYMLTHKLLKCKVGLIHSHHSMPTFFSGTDRDTLLTDGSEMSNFVSLIVNNAGTYSAAITRKVAVKRDIQEEFYQPFFGEGVQTTHKTSFTQDVQYVEWFDLHIEKERPKALTEISERIAQIKEVKAQEAQEAQKARQIQRVQKDNNLSSQSSSSSSSHRRYYSDAYDDYHISSLWEDFSVEDKTPPIALRTGNEMLFDTGSDTRVEEALTKFVSENLTNNDITQITHKLITGSVVALKLDNKSLDSWKRLMVPTYDRTFKELDDFKEFAGWYVEFIINRIGFMLLEKLNIKELRDVVDVEDLSPIVAQRVYDKLESFPCNLYIDGYKNVLLNILTK